MIRLINLMDKIVYRVVVGGIRLIIGLIGFIILLIIGAIAM